MILKNRTPHLTMLPAPAPSGSASKKSRVLMAIRR
jgi:hypothetical protein